MRTLAGIALLAACGEAASIGPAATKPQQPPPQVAKVEPAKPAALTADVFCEHYAKLSACPWYDKIGMDQAGCLKTFGSEDPDAAQALAQFGHCVMEHTDCMEVANCFAAAGPGTEELRACNENKPEHAVGMPADEWAHRKGADVTRFSDAASTKAEPIEVCGIPTENQWLTQVTCDDGSNPFADPQKAEEARVGNLGEGGRCGSIIDLYRVKCPEATYEIYLDGYVCPLASSN